MTDQFITLNGLRLHYIEYGGPESPTLIMLHGLRGYARSWHSVASTLDDRYHIIALDQRGRGESEWDPQQRYFAESYVSDLEQLVAQLDLRQVVLMGHSMGGVNAILYAARHPDQVHAIVLEEAGPSGKRPVPAPGWGRATAESTPDSFATWDAARQFSLKQRPARTPEDLEGRIHGSLKEGADGTIRWKADLEGIERARAAEKKSAPDLWEPVRAVQFPALVLRGEHTDMLSREIGEGMVAANPHFRLLEIANAGHFVHEDNPDDFNAEVNSFLNSL